MGMSEFDRIRSKNSEHEKAFTLYTNLKAEGLTDPGILSYIEGLLTGNLNYDRSEIYSAVMRIARRYHVSGSAV